MREMRGGQAVILLLLALGTFLLGAVGLAVESSLYYSQRQMAQAAADAAAQAAMTSIFARTNTGTNLMDGTPFDCTNGTDLRTPCHFARRHQFGTAGSGDTVSVDFPLSIPGVGDLAEDSPNMVGVTISRPVTTGLLQFVGGQTATIRARGVAAILIELSPVPILVMHPDFPDTMEINGNPTIRICGGPPRSIQVNSENTLSFDVSGGGGSNFVDLSGAGPGGTLLGCDGTGGEFGNHGGPFNFSAASNGYPGGTILPADNYIQTLPIDDPLARPMPAGLEPANPGPPVLGPYPVTATGAGAADPEGCPLPAGEECVVYSPGEYVGGMVIKNEMALLLPGLYYMEGGGFSIQANGIVHMKRPCAPVAPFNCGVMIYNNPGNANDIFDIWANAGQYQGVAYTQDIQAAGTTVSCTGNCFQGPAETSPYYNVVFMNSRNYNQYQEHSFQGGGGLTIAGTIYFTNSFSPNKVDLFGNADYQVLILQGTPGSNTQVVGQILVDSLELGGNATITMTLNPNTVLPIRKLALVR